MQCSSFRLPQASSVCFKEGICPIKFLVPDDDGPLELYAFVMKLNTAYTIAENLIDQGIFTLDEG